MLGEFATKHSNWLLLVASQILTEVTMQDLESLRTGPKERIENNQRLAAQKINSVREREFRRDILLDAHCIIDNGYELVRVPVGAIQNLNPTALVYIWDEVQRIHDKRRLDRVRVRPERTVQQLRVYQQAVIETCEDYHAQLGIQLACVRAGDTRALERALEPN